MHNARYIGLLAVALAALTATSAFAQLSFDPQVFEPIAIDDIGRTACHDVDGVNGPDLVSGSDDTAGGTYFIRLNNGDGGFDSGMFINGGGQAPDIAVGDWDGDGLTDILGVEDWSVNDRLGFVRQISAGVWDRVDDLIFAGQRSLIVTGDFNGDAQIDFAVGNPAAGTVEVYLNDGSGGVAALVADSYAMGVTTDLRCCDFNADGAPDIVSVSASDGFLRVRLNDGIGNFAAATLYFMGAGSSPSWIACSDLNGDGYPDLAIANKGTDTVSVLRSNGTGGFLITPPVPAGPTPSQVVCGDFDCDGDADIVVSRGTGAGSVLRALLNDDGTATSWTMSALFGGPNAGGVIDLHAAELDGEAGTDLVKIVAPTPIASAQAFLNIGSACGTCIDAPPDAVAWYAGDLCFPDDLYDNHDGAFLGLPSCPLPWIGTGAPGLARVPHDCELDPDDHGFTVNTWVRTNGPGFQPIAGKTGAPGYELSLFDGIARAIICDSSFCWITEGSSFINDGDWHHVAFTLQRGPGSNIAIWVDGVLENTTSVVGLGTVSSTNDLLLGASPSGTPTSFLDGAYDELQVFDRALSAAEIHAIYLAGIAGQCKDVCAPSGVCVSPEFPAITAGTEDDFALPSEPATPGAVLAATCAGSVDFDVLPAGASVCHTFDALPEKIVGGTLTVRIKANGTGGPCNDEISLQATGGFPMFLWGRRIGEAGTGLCSGSDGLIDCEWEAPREYTLCLDLAALPTFGGTTTSVIDDMNATGRLDVRVLDDTAVDFMQLRLTTCPCPSDLSGNGSVGFEDTLQIIANWGPCPDPCPGTPCPWDLNGNCTVDFADILVVIATWGPC